MILTSSEPFDPKSVPVKRWRDYEEGDWDTDSITSSSTYQTNTKSYVPTEFSGKGPRSEYFAPGNNRSSIQAKNFTRESMISYQGNGIPDATPSISSGRSNRSSVIPGPFSHSDLVITDELLFAEIQQSLFGADLMTLTKKQIRDNLSIKLGVDLKPRKEVMNRMIDEVLTKQV